MIVIRDCCDHVPPVIENDVFGGIFVYCPVCGYTVHDQTLDEALSKWNDYRNGVNHGKKPIKCLEPICMSCKYCLSIIKASTNRYDVDCSHNPNLGGVTKTFSRCRSYRKA